MTDKKTAARMSAESRFKRKEEQTREGAKAMAEYEAAAKSRHANMERLRALRLAKEAEDEKAAAEKAAEKAKTKKAPRKKKA